MNKGLQFIVVLGVLFICLSPCAYSQLRRSMRQIPIGNFDYQGYARMDKIFYKMPLGDGRFADFFFKFTSDPSLEPKYMGLYWTIPFFDTSVTQVSNNRYIWKSPNHGTYTFNKASKADKGFEETYILNTTGKWKLNVVKNEIVINNTDDPKNLFKFKDGRLSLFCGGKDSDTFRLSYTNGFPNVVYNLTKSAEELRLEYNSERFLTRIIFPRDKKSLFISYSPCNTYASDGITKQGKLYKSVSSITFVDGNKEEYKYLAEADKKRTYLTKNSKEGETKVSANKLTQVRSGNESGFISWDATTGIIISDSGGEYAVRNPLIDKFSPEYDAYESYRKRSSRTQESRISYKKPEYKYAEIWDYSSRNAIKITQDPNTGEQTRTSYIGNPGNASMKVRKVERKSASDNDWKINITKTYDDNGNIIREIDGLGNLTEFIYDKKGSHWKTLRNGSLLYLAYNDDTRDPLKYLKENNDGSVTRIVKNDKGSLKIQQIKSNSARTIATFDNNMLYIKGFKFIIKNER